MGKLRLRLLGGAVILDDDRPLGGTAAHRHPVALMTLLSVGGVMSRDKLIGYLWPERETESARNLLKTAVHDMRKLFGDSAILSIGDQLSVDKALVPCDVADFEAAIAAKDWERAASLYAGPFLDGFFLKDAAEFEHWCDMRRARLAESHERAQGHRVSQPGKATSGPTRQIRLPGPTELSSTTRRRWLTAAVVVAVVATGATTIAVGSSTDEGAPGFGTSPLAVILPDTQRGSALLFDGATSTASTKLGTVVTKETDNVAVHLMLRWDGPNDAKHQIPYYNGHGGVSGWGIMIVGTQDAQPDGTIALLAGGINVVATPLRLTPGTWQQLSILRRNGRVTVLLDDQHHDVGAFPVAPIGERYASMERTSIGGDGTHDAPAGFFRGAIDRVFVMNLASNYSYDRLYFDEGQGARSVGLKGTFVHLGEAQWTQGPPVEPRSVFWSRLEPLCGHAYAGTMTEGQAQDSVMRTSRLVLDVRSCTPVEMRMALHVGSDRSRTWVLSRTADGFRLKHEHRHEDGSFDAVTNYGGETRSAGTAGRQDFYADAHTATLIPAARTNVWTIEVGDGRLAYALRREGTDRRVRLEFDISGTVAAPPPPWGASPR